jgi:hypothetical protein
VLDPSGSSVVVSTSTFTEDEYEEMDRLRVFYTLAEDFGILRQVSRFIRQETGLREIDFYVGVLERTRAAPARYPAMALVANTTQHFMAPPVSWQFFIDELRHYVIDELGVTGNSALDTALAVQAAVLPSASRRYPDSLDLAHDWAAWWTEVMAQKRTGDPDWHPVVPRLDTFPPATFVVDDPFGIITQRLGAPFQMHALGLNWELKTPTTRGMSDEAFMRMVESFKQLEGENGGLVAAAAT